MSVLATQRPCPSATSTTELRPPRQDFFAPGITRLVNSSSAPWRLRPLISQNGEQHHAHPRLDPLLLQFDRRWLGVGLSAAVGGAAALLEVQRRSRVAALGLGALGLACGVYTTLFEPTHPQLERVTLHLTTLPPALDGLRIGHLSDPHLGLPYAAKNLAWAVAQMRREQPDLLALTGDFVGVYEAVPEIPALLRGLSAPLGVYAVPGNHDYWDDLTDVRGALSLIGIPLLANEQRRLRWNGVDFWLAGLDDVWHGQPDWSRTLRGIPPGAFTLLLCHAPDAVDEAARHGVSVQLSGHTHGGHLRMPGLGPFSLPRFGRRYPLGHYQIGATQMYVSRGLGGIPMRLFCRPEATIITLRRST